MAQIMSFIFGYFEHLHNVYLDILQQGKGGGRIRAVYINAPPTSTILYAAPTTEHCRSSIEDCLSWRGMYGLQAPNYEKPINPNNKNGSYL